jgi:hypothetical protein
MQKTICYLTIAAIAIFSSSSPAYAYLDPGTGSMIVQLLLGGLAGAFFVVKVYWEKIKTLFVKQDKVENTQDKV